MNKILLIKSSGAAGLGDRLQALLSGLHYAHISGRSVYVCWDDGLYGAVGENIFFHFFTIQGLSTDVNSLVRYPPEEVFPVLWQDKLNQTFNQVYADSCKELWNRAWALQNLSFDLSRFDYREKILVMWDSDQFVNSWSSADPAIRYGNSPEEALHITAKNHLQIVPELQSALEKFKDTHFQRRMIGVHVRRTYEQGGSTRHVPNYRYFKIIDRLLKKDTGIFLATDNKAVEDRFRKRYPDLVTTEKWLPDKPGEAVHFARNEAMDKHAILREAITDLYLLASCDFLVYPGASSFSRLASILGNFSDHHLYPLHTRIRKIFGITLHY